MSWSWRKQGVPGSAIRMLREWKEDESEWTFKRRLINVNRECGWSVRIRPSFNSIGGDTASTGALTCPVFCRLGIAITLIEISRIFQ
jgi:hypothetical protein